MVGIDSKCTLAGTFRKGTVAICKKPAKFTTDMEENNIATGKYMHRARRQFKL